ncbi:MAG: hypothetical protein H6733_05560 [Alphaproteobacteria bacterium]|nr:hypothetical protein [Alphaproteobacteria bacterium]
MPETVSGQQRRVAVVGFGAVAVIAGLLWWQRSGDERPTRDGPTVVWDLHRRDVRLIDVASPAGAWEVAVDAGGAAQVRCGSAAGTGDAEAVNDLLDAIEEARRGEDVSGIDPDDAGLVGDVVVLEISTARGRVSVRVGGDAPVGARTYVQVDDRVVAVRGGLGASVRQPCTTLLADSPP